MAGEKAPTLLIHFEATGAEPPPSQIRRTIKTSIYRTGPVDAEGGMDPSIMRLASAAGVGEEGVKRKQGRSESPRDRSATSRATERPSFNGTMVRQSSCDVPPIPGQRVSMHELDLGSIDKSGRFSVHVSFSAMRITTSRDTSLTTPPVEHPPLYFVVKPQGAVAGQSKISLRMGGPAQDSSWANKSASKGLVPAEPLIVNVGDPLTVCILARDRFVNYWS